MRVVCDNCGASYKIPDSKLTREVNKATCRKCGHAIYIRKNGVENAESPVPASEERTQIKSVGDLDRPTAVQHDASGGESTIPRDEPMPPEPAMSARGGGVTLLPDDARQQVSGGYPGANGNGNGYAGNPPAVDRDRPTIASQTPPADWPAKPAGRSIPPGPAASPRQSNPPVATAAPVAVSPTPSAVQPAYAPPAAPLAAPRPMADAGPAYDPSGDLTIALIGAAVALVGVVGLVTANLLANAWVGAGGSFLALFGLLIIVLLLLTGGRGTRKASLLAALALSTVISLAAALAISGGSWWLKSGPNPSVAVVTPPHSAKTDAAAATMADVAVPAAVPAVASAPTAPPVDATAPAVAPAGTAPAVTAPVPAPAPQANAQPAAPTRIQPSASSQQDAQAAADKAAADRAASDKAAADKAASDKAAAAARAAAANNSRTSSNTYSQPTRTATVAPAPTPAPAAAAPAISLQVVDVMLRSNKGVKTCFINEMHDNGGSVPKGVKVKLTIAPSGKVSSASTQGDYSGTPFDSCLGSAIKAITFPPSQGDPITLTYPFQT